MTKNAEKLLEIAYDEYIRRLKSGIPRFQAEEFMFVGNDLPKAFREWNYQDFHADLEVLQNEGFIGRKVRKFYLQSKAIEYFESSKLPETASTTTNNFNFGNAQIGNAVIGNQQSVTMNIGNGLDDVYRAIIAKPLVDQKLLLEMLEELKRIERSGEPIQKGRLSRFADGVDKFSDIVIAVGGFLAGFIFK